MDWRTLRKGSARPADPGGRLCLFQLLWREFFYTVGHGTPRFDCMEGNRVCKQIPWSDDDALLAAWRDAKTG